MPKKSTRTNADLIKAQAGGFDTPVSGEFRVTASAAVLPTVDCNMVQFKAKSTNTGKIYIGGAGVTVADGNTDTTTGLELNASDSSGWLPISNLNVLYAIGTVVGDSFTYLAFI